jgi:hypothetical protein
LLRQLGHLARPRDTSLGIGDEGEEIRPQTIDRGFGTSVRHVARFGISRPLSSRGQPGFNSIADLPYVIRSPC